MSASPTPVVSFIVPVRNDAAQLRRCLRSIAATRHPAASIEVVVADNGSTDESADVARAEGATVLLVASARLGELRNLAAGAARGEILAFVDADHEIVPDWVPSAISTLGDPRVAAVGAPYRPPSPATWVQRLYDGLRRHHDGQHEVEWLGSGNMAVRRSAFDAVAGFDSSLDTCEDVDLCRKLRVRGFSIVADSRLQSRHYGDPRTLRGVFSGELWRGRDNLRVSFRPPRSWRAIVSAAIPMVNLLALATVVAGVLSVSAAGATAAAMAGLTILVLVGLRAAVLMTRGASTRDLPRALAVAAAYEGGRALALTGRFGHGHRRKGATA